MRAGTRSTPSRVHYEEVQTDSKAQVRACSVKHVASRCPWWRGDSLPDGWVSIRVGAYPMCHGAPVPGRSCPSSDIEGADRMGSLGEHRSPPTDPAALHRSGDPGAGSEPPTPCSLRRSDPGLGCLARQDPGAPPWLWSSGGPRMGPPDPPDAPTAALWGGGFPHAGQLAEPTRLAQLAHHGLPPIERRGKP